MARSGANITISRKFLQDLPKEKVSEQQKNVSSKALQALQRDGVPDHIIQSSQKEKASRKAIAPIRTDPSTVSNEKILQLLQKEIPSSEEAIALIQTVRARLDILEKEYLSPKYVRYNIPSVVEIKRELREKIKELQEEGGVDDSVVCEMEKYCLKKIEHPGIKYEKWEHTDELYSCMIGSESTHNSIFISITTTNPVDDECNIISNKKRAVAIAKSGLKYISNPDNHYETHTREIKFGPYPINMPQLIPMLATLIHKKFLEINKNLC